MPGHTGCLGTLDGPTRPRALGEPHTLCSFGRAGAGESSFGRAPGGRPLQMEWSGWDHRPQIRAAWGGPGAPPAPHSAPPPRVGHGGLGRVRAEAGRTPSVTDVRPSRVTCQGGNVLCSLPGKRKRKKNSAQESPSEFTFISPKVVSVSDARREVTKPSGLF